MRCRFQTIASTVTSVQSWNLTLSRKVKSQRVWSLLSIFHSLATGGQAGDALGMGEPVDQPVERREAAEAEALARWWSACRTRSSRYAMSGRVRAVS